MSVAWPLVGKELVSWLRVQDWESWLAEQEKVMERLVFSNRCPVPNQQNVVYIIKWSWIQLLLPHWQRNKKIYRNSDQKINLPSPRTLHMKPARNIKTQKFYKDMSCKNHFNLSERQRHNQFNRTLASVSRRKEATTNNTALEAIAGSKQSEEACCWRSRKKWV